MSCGVPVCHDHKPAAGGGGGEEGGRGDSDMRSIDASKARVMFVGCFKKEDGDFIQQVLENNVKAFKQKPTRA